MQLILGSMPLLQEAPGIDPYKFQTYSMFTLLFLFEGSRKLSASRLVAGDDLVAELEAGAKVLETHYAHHRVRSVEIIAYDRGRNDYFPWEEGLELLSEFGVATVLEDTSAQEATPEETTEL